MPDEFSKMDIVPVYKKKGDKLQCNNYRGITLISVAAKVYAIILERRLRQQVESKLAEAQCGFRPNRSTADAILTLRLMTEQTIEFKKPLHLLFLDLEKAYDFVKRDQVWKALEDKGVDSGLLLAIKSLYKESLLKVKINGKRSNAFRVHRGLRQGCPLSPLLFIVVFDSVLKELEAVKKGFPIEKLQAFINALAFADDTVLVGMDHAEILELLAVFQEACKKIGVKINAGKTKYMVVARESSKIDRTKFEVKIEVEPNKFEQVELVSSFVYLGSTITQDGKNEQAVNDRLSKAGKAFGAYIKFLSRKGLSLDAKLKIVKCVLVATAKYGLETMALTDKEQARLDVAQMKWLRRCLGVSKVEKKQNEEIRVTCGLEANLSYVIAREKVRYVGHIFRMADERLPKIMLEWEAPEIKDAAGKKVWSRPRGKPRGTWEEGIEKTLELVLPEAAFNNKGSLNWEWVKGYAQDRERWRQLVITVEFELMRGNELLAFLFEPA